MPVSSLVMEPGLTKAALPALVVVGTAMTRPKARPNPELRRAVLREVVRQTLAIQPHLEAALPDEHAVLGDRLEMSPRLLQGDTVVYVLELVHTSQHNSNADHHIQAPRQRLRGLTFAMM